MPNERRTNSTRKSTSRGVARFLVLAVLAAVAQHSSPQEPGVLGTARWFLQTLPAEAPPAGNTPESGLYAQLLPAVGRDDLWLGRPQRAMEACEELPASEGSILDYVAERATSTRIVIINEAHDVPRHRAFTESLLDRLWDQGFRYFAAEAFAEHIGNHADEGFGRIDAGFYATESTFGRLIRTAKRLGYTLVPYEAVDTSDASSLSVSERMDRREEEQANRLMARVFAADPAAKLVVHVGHSHAAEVPLPSSGGSALSWMAARLKEKSGIDPLTIDQTYCRSSGDGLQLARPTGRMPPGTFDLAIAYPAISITEARATWRRSRGERLVYPPQRAVPDVGRAILEARRVDEPDAAIPIDRLLLLPSESIPLVLPRGEYRLTVTKENAAGLEEFRLIVD